MLKRRGVFGLARHDKVENAGDVLGGKSYDVKEVEIKCEGEACGMSYTIFDETFKPVKCALCGSEKIIISKED